MDDDPRSARTPGGPPAPARPASAASNARPGDRAPQPATPKQGGGTGTTPLMPARALGRKEAPPSPTVPDTEHVEVEVDGRPWLVRVRGRSVGGGVARVPMLLLGFWPGESNAVEPERESLVVGRTLGAFSVYDLERAFARSRKPTPLVARPAAAKERRGRRGGATHRRDR